MVFVDTDLEHDGEPAEWAVAPSFDAFRDRLTFASSRHHIAVLDVSHADILLDAAAAMGAVGDIRPDHEGAVTRALDGWRCDEDGPALLRILPPRRPDGSPRLPELVEPGKDLWVAETNVTDVTRFIATFERVMPGRHLRLTI